MSESNKMVIRQLFDLYNEGALDMLEGLVSPDYVHHNNDANLTFAQFKRGAAWLRAGMPDFHLVTEDMLAEADKVAVRFIGRGTHLGSLYGETPTSRSVALHGMVVYRLHDNKVAEDWEIADEHDLMKQVGAVAQDG